MYILISSYSKKPEIAEPHFPEHCKWLNENINNGNFLASGPKTSNLGGVIIAKSMDKAQLREIINQDSYVKADVADYLIVEANFKLSSLRSQLLGS